MLQVANVSKSYGQLAALSAVSFTIRPGEVLGLIGPNGSGKTTLFECLGGVLPSDGGALLSGSRPLSTADRVATIFYLPDQISPWPSEPVRWALDFTLGYWRDDERDAPRRPSAEDVVARLELEPLLDKRMGALSKGQRKRALLGIGLLTPQPILLADEPFEGLDLRQTREMARALRHFAAQGRTMLLSIHQIADAARVCDRFVLLSGGRMRGEGTIGELAAAARVASTDLEEIFLALT